MRKLLPQLLLLLSLLPYNAFATIAVGYTNFTGSSSSVTTIATIAGTTQATGSTFVVVVTSRQTVTPTSVTDTFSNTYTLAQSTIGFNGTWLYYCINCTGGASHVVTATWAAAAVANAVALVEFTGVGAGTFDTAPTGISNTSGGTTGTAPSITTSVANELVVDCFTTYSGSGETSITNSGAGFAIAVSQLGNTTSNGAVSWTVPASSGTAAADTYTWTNFDYSNYLSLAIKPAAGAPVVNGAVMSNGHPVKSGSAVLYK